MQRAYREAAIEYARRTHELVEVVNKLPTVADTTRRVNSVPALMSELADMGLALDHIQTNIEELKKLVSKRKSEVENTVAALYAEAGVVGRAIETPYVSAKVRFKVSTPSLKRTEENHLIYDRFCREVLGITDQSLIESGSVTTHYKYWGEYLTRLTTEGYSLPAELLGAIKEYKEAHLEYKRKELSIFNDIPEA